MLSPVIRFTSLIFYLNNLLDEGKTADVDETLSHVRDGTVFQWLADTYGPGFTFALFLTSTEDAEPVLEVLQQCEGLGDLDKYLARNNGLAVLLAFAVEGIQLATPPPT